MCAALSGITVVGTGGVAAAVTDEDPEFRVNKADLEFILKQIKISEAHTKRLIEDPEGDGDLVCADRTDTSWTCVPDPKLPWGLRTVDGSYNNLYEGREMYGAAGQVFPRLLDPWFRDADPLPDYLVGRGTTQLAGQSTSYKQKNGWVVDTEPRMVSNLIVDQTVANPAAVQSLTDLGGLGATEYDHDGKAQTPNAVFLPNVSPDEGLSAPFNSWFTLFGQFFDHGLDLVSKGDNGTVVVPLQPEDPLYDHTPGARTNFLVLTRATNLAGRDGEVGTADDIQEHTNRTTPYVDQNQTYTSHPAHQVFLREYEATATGPVPTGNLLSGVGVNDSHGLVTWAEVKTHARVLLGIELDDNDVHNVPLVATDPYGRFLPGPNGYPQLVMAGSPDNTLVEGNPDAPIDASLAVKAGVAFLDDIAHNAVPTKTPDGDDIVNSVFTPPAAGAYDNELLEAHFITGDGRGNENIGLTSVHHVFHSEHNRMVEQIDELITTSTDQQFKDAWHDESGPWDYGERLFQAGRFVTEMEYQHLVFEEFARKIQPSIDRGPLNETLYHQDVNAAVTAEFAHVVYRFGHSMLTDTIDRQGAVDDSLPLLQGFLNPPAFTNYGHLTHDAGAGAIIQGMTRQTGNGIDEFIVPTLRNNLLGLPLDLATINMVRARDAGIPSLQTARKAFYAESFNSALKPYASWEEFRRALKHRASIVNFVAAYGKHPSVQEATTVAAKRAAAEVLVQDSAFMNLPSSQSGLDDVDFWVGGLAERGMDMGGMLGTTFNHVFEEHMESLQNGDRFYYLTRTQGMNLIHQLEGNSFTELIMRNTDAERLPADAFASQDLSIDLGNLPTPLPTGLTLMADGSYRWDGDEHVSIHGTPANESIRGGDGDDALWGYGGVDSLEGDVGDDILHGGADNDILTDLFGNDVIHGDGGDDAINAGPGLDLVFGNSGRDFIAHGQEVTQSFAGAGADLLKGGHAGDIMTGNEADDWMEGGRGADLVQGDNALTFQNDPNGGSDILYGGSGMDDHDAEGGNDIMLNNGIDRHAGMLGFDWVTHKFDPDPVDADLDVTIFQPPNVTLMRSRFFNVEGLSGWQGNDVLRGNNSQGDQAFEGGEGHELTQKHLDEVIGLRELLGGGDVPRYATSFLATNRSNNIILGGAGSDLIQGRGGDDFIDGDAWLDVYLKGPDGVAHGSLDDFQQQIFDGTLSPAEINLFREVVTPTGQEDVIDTAFYEDVRANHVVTEIGDGLWRVAHAEQDAGGLSSGVDILRNIERLQFADETVDLVTLENGAASGTITFDSLQPVEDQPITLTPDFTDPQGIDAASIAYAWQFGDDEGEWTASATGTGTSFTPGDAEAGWPLRVIATFNDGAGNLEQIVSQATLPVTNVNDKPTGPVLNTMTPIVGTVLTADEPVDSDGTHNDDGDLLVDFVYQWQQGSGDSFTDVAGATGKSFDVTQEQAGKQLRVVVSYTDVQGTQEQAISAATEAVQVVEPAGAPSSVTATPDGPGAVLLSWSPPVDTGGGAILGFTVQVISGGEEVRTIPGISAAQPRTTITGLTPGTEYRFRVLAVNLAGEGALSEPATAIAPKGGDPEPGADNGDGGNGDGDTGNSDNTDGNTGGDVGTGGNGTDSGTPDGGTDNGGTGGDTGGDTGNGTGGDNTGGDGNPADPMPTLMSQLPAPRATDVERSTSVTLMFDRPVAGLEDAKVVLRRPGKRPVKATLGYDPETHMVSIDPKRRLASGARYVVRVVGLTNEAGTPLGRITWRFTTADDKSPRVRPVRPGHRGGDLARRANVKARFTEQVVRVNARNVRLHTTDGDRVRAKVRYNPRNRMVTINPRAALPRGTRFVVSFSSRIRDTAGNPLPAARWRFTTRR